MKFYGLSDAEIEKSRAKWGLNKIPESRPTTFLNEFRQAFSDPMIKILILIVFIMFAMFFFGQAEIYEPIGTLIAIIIVAVVTAKTGVASDLKYRELKRKSKKQTCKALRNGGVCVVDFDDVVVGDKIIVQSGDKIPADGVLIDGCLKVNNSALNGEVEQCLKRASEEDLEFPEKITGETFLEENFLFRGSVVGDGEGIFCVKKVGTETMMGKMAEQMQESEPDSPLKIKLKKLAGQISKIGYAAAMAIFVLYMAYFVACAGGISSYISLGFEKILIDFLEAVSLSILIVVCAVPEGLPLMISLVLMQNTSRMLDHNVLVRKAIGIETAGSLNILFSDKTGTITKGQLEVTEFFLGDGTAIDLGKLCKDSKVRTLLNISIAKNSSSMFDSKNNVVGGNVTDQAMTRFLGKDEYDSLNKSEQYIVGKHQEFNSKNKFSQIEIKNLEKVIYKGAPEVLLQKSKKFLTVDGKVQDISLEKINEKINEYASMAMRILAFGYSKKNYTQSNVNDDLVILGFLAIKDEVRPQAKSAIQEVKKAGISVVMITGDRLETAVEIAKDAGLIDKPSDIALTSKQLNEMSDEQVKKIIQNVRVIARALPTDKSRMVRICQEMNLVVGMTGDGVNDSPALKRADVGFAMGSGTEAAKEAGKIVILDDNFCSIRDAILYGRTIYHNILKFCKFQLTINVAAVVVSGFSPFFGMVAPLKVVHLLFINLIMDSFGALMFGKEPALEKYMLEKPRIRDENIIKKPMIFQILFASCWVVLVSLCFLNLPIFTSFFENQSQLYSAYFVLFVWMALFNGFNVRDNKFNIFNKLSQNPNFLVILFIIIGIQMIIVNSGSAPIEFFRYIGNIFDCVAFDLKGWVLVFLLAVSIIPADIFRKILVQKFKSN